MGRCVQDGQNVSAPLSPRLVGFDVATGVNRAHYGRTWLRDSGQGVKA